MTDQILATESPSSGTQRERRSLWRLRSCWIVVAALVTLLAGCAPGDAGDSSGGVVTVPPSGSSDASVPDGTASATTVVGAVALDQSWFGQPSEKAIPEIESLGIYVADFLVCSGSVAAGEVRQITTSEGVILDDKDGLTPAAQAIALGSVVQMKVGNGRPCD